MSGCWGDKGNCSWCDLVVREACTRPRTVAPLPALAPATPMLNRRLWRNRHMAYPIVENVVRLMPKMKKENPNTVIPRRQMEWIVQQVIENIETMRRMKGA